MEHLWSGELGESVCFSSRFGSINDVSGLFKPLVSSNSVFGLLKPFVGILQRLHCHLGKTRFYLQELGRRVEQS